MYTFFLLLVALFAIWRPFCFIFVLIVIVNIIIIVNVIVNVIVIAIISTLNKYSWVKNRWISIICVVALCLHAVCQYKYVNILDAILKRCWKNIDLKTYTKGYVIIEPQQFYALWDNIYTYI